MVSLDIENKGHTIFHGTPPFETLPETSSFSLHLSSCKKEANFAVMSYIPPTA